MSAHNPAGVRDASAPAPIHPEIALRTDRLVVEFSDSHGIAHRPIDELTVEIPRGQFVCLLGPSGHGKSTLLRSFAGLQPPTSGSISTSHGPIRGPGADRGLVFQGDAIPMWLRVRENVAFGPRLRRVPKREYEPRVEHLLEEVGLAHRATAWPRELSGGMRKRVAIAAVFANDPDVLLLDEPFGALDFFTRSKLQALLTRLWSETGKTIVFVTHDVDEALTLADRILVLSHGRLATDESVGFPRPRGDELRMDAAANEQRARLLALLEGNR